MVLFLYVIMLLNLNQDTEPQKKTLYKFSAIISGGLLMLLLVASLKGAESPQLVFGANSEIGLVKNLGRMLFNEFLLPFEIVSVLLLAAMVGAVMLGKNSLTSDARRGSNGRTEEAVKIKNINQVTNE